MSRKIYRLWNPAFIAFLVSISLGLIASMGVPLGAFWDDGQWTLDRLNALGPADRKFLYVIVALIPAAIVSCGFLSGAGRARKILRIITTLVSVVATALLLLTLFGIAFGSAMSH